MPEIVRVHGREVLDSRGRPTVEAEIQCAGGRLARAIVPSGASTGTAEACELRDSGRRLRGYGVRQAVANVNTVIGPALIGCDADDQQHIDARMCELDGTPNKSRLGANAILACSLATAYAATEAKGCTIVEHFAELWGRQHPAMERRHKADTLGTKPMLPLPMVNMISGGLHAGRNLDFQDFLIIPVGAARFGEALDWIVEVYFQLGRVLTEQNYEGVLVGDEGGYGPKLNSAEQACELILNAIDQVGLKPGVQIALALDVASSHFYDQGVYRLNSQSGTTDLSSAQMIEELERLAKTYPIISIEDGLAENDWNGWKQLTARLGARVQLIGDDLFATNPARLQQGINAGAANSVLIKLNQIGTLTQTLETMRLALDHDYRPVVSARSGETEDATIADLAVATGAGQIKIGSVARSERLAKYNQLLRWEERLGTAAPFSSPFVF